MSFGNFWFRKGDDSIKRITDILNEEAGDEESIDVTPSIIEACELLKEIADVFHTPLEPIHAYESSQYDAIADYEAQQEKTKEKLEIVKANLDEIMPGVERSIKNLTWTQNENKHIKADEAVPFIKNVNYSIPIIQDGFDELSAQIINYMQSINNLIEILNTKNKTLPKKPNIPLRPIQKLVNHFHRK